MKKFCSECGHPLEVNKRFCSDCGNANPFHSLSFEFTAVRTNTMEKLRQKRLTIERQLEEIEDEQQELMKKEQLRKEMAELEKQRVDRQEKEKEIKEKFERDEIGAILKKEIQQVKDEAEAYKHQTTELLKELRHVIVQIDEENKRLKEEVEHISKVQPTISAPVIAVEIEAEPAVEASAEEEVAPIEPTEKKTSGSRKFIWGIVAVLFLAANLFVYFRYFHYTNGQMPQTASLAPPVIPAKVAPSEEIITEPIATDEKVTPEVVKSETPVAVVKEKKIKVEVPKEKALPAPVAAAPVSEKKSSKSVFHLTKLTAKKDLVGKKLSGCGITLLNTSEVKDITEPVLVENSAANGYVKYKMSVKVAQDGETYSVTPYVYYSPSGQFIKIDASNCE